MLYMLDTNAVSYLIHKRSRKLQEQMDALPPGDRLCISAITEAELRYGVALRKGAIRLTHALEPTPPKPMRPSGCRIADSDCRQGTSTF